MHNIKGQQFEGTLSRKPSQVTPNSEIGPAGSFTQKAMDPNQMLRQLLAEPDNKYVTQPKFQLIWCISDKINYDHAFPGMSVLKILQQNSSN